MKWLNTILSLSSAVNYVTALETRDTSDASVALPGGYAPRVVKCPSARPSLRDSLSLSPKERLWLGKRRSNTIDATRDLIKRLGITGFDQDSYFQHVDTSHLPNIGIAISGGGYRAMLNGAGAIAAFDNRTRGATGPGQLGGLLQSATYLSGLSGGGWLISSLYGNGFPAIDELLEQDGQDSLWQLQYPMWEGPSISETLGESGKTFIAMLIDQVQGKIQAGYSTSITDLWGRGLAYQLLNATKANASHTFSSIQNDTNFASGSLPMPILVADGRDEGQTQLFTQNSTNYEFNPWEVGSFDDVGFAPLQYVGSNFSAGKIRSGEDCVVGFDQLSFVYGTSSSLFNQIILQMDSSDAIPHFLKGLLKSFLKQLGDEYNDIADWSPNPFYGWKPQRNRNANSTRLTLVDGGEDLQNIPFTPLVHPERHVDVIFAVDSSADTLGKGGLDWPNGTAMVATYERSLAQYGGTTFPPVPDVNTFINLGLNARPTMFGCDARNLSTNSTAPLIVYIPNSPYTYLSNVSTFTMAYETDKRNALVQNGYNVATKGNGTVDSQWGKCVGCAIMARSWNRTGTKVPSVCNDCFENFCWNGTVDSREPATYMPAPALSLQTLQSMAMTLNPSAKALVVGIVIGLLYIQG